MYTPKGSAWVSANLLPNVPLAWHVLQALSIMTPSLLTPLSLAAIVLLCGAMRGVTAGDWRTGRATFYGNEPWYWSIHHGSKFMGVHNCKLSVYLLCSGCWAPGALQSSAYHATASRFDHEWHLPSPFEGLLQ